MGMGSFYCYNVAYINIHMVDSSQQVCIDRMSTTDIGHRKTGGSTGVLSHRHREVSVQMSFQYQH